MHLAHSPLGAPSATELATPTGAYSLHSSGWMGAGTFCFSRFTSCRVVWDAMRCAHTRTAARQPVASLPPLPLVEGTRTMAATKRFARIRWSCRLAHAECNQVRPFSLQGGAHHCLFQRQPCCSVIRTYHHPGGGLRRPGASIFSLGRACPAAPKPTSLPAHPVHEGVPTGLPHASNNSLVRVPRPVRPSRSEGFIRRCRP